MNKKLYDYDPSAALTSVENIAVFLADAFETGDADHITEVLAMLLHREAGCFALESLSPDTTAHFVSANSRRQEITLRSLLEVINALNVVLTIRSRG